MPSLLNFDPLLNTYDPNAGQEDIRQGMKEAAGYISRGIEIAGQRGREREDKFESVFDVDISKVTDLESKKYLVGEYSKLKRSYVDKFAKNKNWLGYGKLSPIEKIDLRGDMDSLKNTAETLRVLDQSLVSATDPKNKKWGYEVDEESKKEYSEAKNSGDVSKMAYLLQKVGKSETGIPFVNFKSVDPNSYINSQVGEIRKSIDSSTEIMKKQKEVGGTTYDESTTLKKFGTPEDARATTYNVISKGEAAPVIEANLMKGSYLTDDEKRLAVESSEQFPLLKYFVDQKADVTPIVEDKIVSHTMSERPTKTSSEETNLRPIKETEAGWEFGSTPIPLAKTVKMSDGKSRLIKGGQVISVKNKNGKSMAQVVVPVESSKELAGYFDEMKNIAKLRESNEISEEEASAMGSKLMNDYMNIGKWEEIDVPTKNIYQELKTGFKIKKLNVEGFNNLKFEEDIDKYSKAQESGISSFMKSNKLSREEAVKILKENNRL